MNLTFYKHAEKNGLYSNIFAHTKLFNDSNEMVLLSEGNYECIPVCAYVHLSVCHADFSKTTAFTYFFCKLLVPIDFYALQNF